MRHIRHGENLKILMAENFSKLTKDITRTQGGKATSIYTEHSKTIP